MFGGGYAILPLLQKDVVEKRRLATKDEVLEYFAVGQCTPGVIAVNTATFIGYRQRGVAGAIFATLGLITPSVIIIEVIAHFLKMFIDNPWVEHAFAGIRIVVVALIVQAVIKFLKSGVKDGAGAVIFAAAFILSTFCDIPSVFVVFGAIVAGIAYGAFRGRREGRA